MCISLVPSEEKLGEVWGRGYMCMCISLVPSEEKLGEVWGRGIVHVH